MRGNIGTVLIDTFGFKELPIGLRTKDIGHSGFVTGSDVFGKDFRCGYSMERSFIVGG
jgi:hypothetical protein